jgi:hypothetical protein
MITKYYKNVSPDSAKNRIAKLVKQSREAWDAWNKISQYADEDSYTYKHSLTKAITYSQALSVMGIVEHECLENI